MKKEIGIKFSKYLEKVKSINEVYKYSEKDFNKCDLNQL